MSLLELLFARPDEASVVASHLTMVDLAALRGVSRAARGWAQGQMRQKLGADGLVRCGTNDLTLDLVTMRFRKGIDPHDRGTLLYTGVRTVNAHGQKCSLLVRPRDRRYALCWDTFADASRAQRLYAHSTPVRVLRPLVLPRTHPDGREGLLVLSPCGNAHDFIPFAKVARFVAGGLPPSELHEHDYAPELHRTDESANWDAHVRAAGLYESALYIPALGGVVYGLQGTLCFKRYDRKGGFDGPVVALPFAHSLGNPPITPIACTYAYDAAVGTLLVVGGRLSSGRKASRVYSFPLRDYLKIAGPAGNTLMTTWGARPVRTDDARAHSPPHLFVPVGTLQHPRAWCHAHLAHGGRVLVVWGGKGKHDRHPSALEVFYRSPTTDRWAPMWSPVACPDNVVW